ncbi:ligand-binding sensor domain-containing protein [Flavihumibacter solisilvae]|uniref:ligand-binding sensor domain-containing protein n=1 Tax=Flavihumibacter solisilvae TaxID=1349421 RepID=UPI000690C352|nr:hypothetical protein [Flavihumibacter solisilvae]
MKKNTVTFFILITSFYASAQNLFPKKLDGCTTDKFCLDCGDVKANVDIVKFNSLISGLNRTNNLKGIKGRVVFQVLVDAIGKGCVLSYTDVSEHVISRNIVNALNGFDGFIPAKTNGKNEERTSFNLSFDIQDGAISGKVDRVDLNAFKKSFDKPNSPEIYNKDYVYNNDNLKNYRITVWNTNNSSLPSNMNDLIAIDKKGIIWLNADDQFVRFDGKQFDVVEPKNDELKKPVEVYRFATDSRNKIWVYGDRKFLSFDGKKWTLYDQSKIVINEASKMIFNEKSDELFICSGRGLTIVKNNTWTDFNRVKKYPFASVYFAKRDSRNRIWIGTFNGSYLIDSIGNCTSFNETSSVLKGQCISAMDEDEYGNLYFGLYEYDSKPPGQINRNEGIAIRSIDGTWKQFTTSNSGMPFNNTTDVRYDKREKVLWISTDRAGLVRYDLKGGWENYHPGNSGIPTSYISQMAFDNNGVLYLATRQGLVKVERL